MIAPFDAQIASTHPCTVVQRSCGSISSDLVSTDAFGSHIVAEISANNPVGAHQSHQSDVAGHLSFVSCHPSDPSDVMSSVGSISMSEPSEHSSSDFRSVFARMSARKKRRVA